MRSIALALGGALLLSACGGAATAPSAAPAAPATTAASPAAASSLKFTADLKAENEVPPIPNDEKSGSGKATVTFDLTRDGAGKIVSAKVSIQATLSGFPTSTAITLAHIHGPAAAGANAGVQIPFKTDADNPILLTTGGTTFTKDGVVFDKADVLQQIVDDPSKFYVNFHSKVNAGVQIPFKTDADNPIPLTTGGTTFTKDGVVFDKADVLQQIVDDPSKFYVNFHSKVNPGGVVRGQLTKA